MIHVRQKLDTSERRTCKTIGLSCSTQRYTPALKTDDEELRLALIRLAKQYGRYGYRKIAHLLRIEGWLVNHKKVERLWCEEGLQLPHRHKRRKRLYHRDSSVIRLRPQYPGHIWSIDFVHDKLSSGRSYKMLTVLDEYTREALCVAARPKMGAVEVLEALHPLFLKHGKPAYLRSDNGPEFIAHDLQAWLKKVGCQRRSKKRPPWRSKKGPPGGCGLVPVVHGRAPRATRRALNRLTRRCAQGGPVGPRGQARAGWSVQFAVGV